MKAQWALLLEKLDALSLRERMILFLTVLFCIGALVQLLWLDPVLTKQRKLEQEAASQTAEAARLRDEIKAAAAAVDPSQVAREEVAHSQKRMDALNQELTVLLPRAQNGPALEQVLVQFLRRYEGLTLLSVKTLADGGTAGLPPGLTKRGIELRVTGPLCRAGGLCAKFGDGVTRFALGFYGAQERSATP